MGYNLILKLLELLYVKELFVLTCNIMFSSGHSVSEVENGFKWLMKQSQAWKQETEWTKVFQKR